MCEQVVIEIPDFQMKLKKAHLIEIEDVFFHHDSAVIMPSQPKGPSSRNGSEPEPSESASAISGITAIMSIYMFAEENPDKRLIIVGHADTTGKPEYNFKLSMYRACSVLYLLMGNKEEWAENSDKKNKVEDYQQILKHYSTLWGWDCDPGPIDNIKGPKTEKAIRQFQEIYNREFKKNIAVDGIVGKETWGAIFDCYIKELADMLNTTPEGMNEYRNKIHFVSDSYKILACGESYPIEEAKKDNYRSQTNRRVEVIFFDPDEEPEINCPNPMGPYNDQACDIEDCPIYKKDTYTFEYVSPKFIGISILDVADHFAPKIESIDIVFKIMDIEGKIKAGRIEIHGTNYPYNPVAILPLDKSNLTPNMKHIITWNGQSTCAEGSLSNGRFINPLYSPYKIVGVVSMDEIFSSGVVRSKEKKCVKVLYHSIELQLGTFTADGNPPNKNSERDKWVQYKLNELGYNAGPVDGIVGNQTKRAIRRYTRALQNRLPDSQESETIDDYLIAALERGYGRREVLEGGKLPNAGESSKIFLDYNYFYIGRDEWLDPRGHLNMDRDKLDRIEFPIEAKILLLKKDSNTEGIFSPYGVGPIRINWSVTDVAEDISSLEDGTNPNIPSPIRPYIERALRLEGGRVAPNNLNDNCHEKYGGFRGAVNEMHRRYFRSGEKLPPYRCEYDDTNRVAYTYAHDDPNNNPEKLGLSGVLFRSSYIAGDNYKIKAQITFEGLQNAVELLNDHGVNNQSELPYKETGIMTIWRRCKVAVVINWPARQRPINWNEVKDMFDQAYNQINSREVPNRNIRDIITQEEFENMCENAIGPAPDGDNYTLRENGIYGLNLPNQVQLGLNAADYCTRLSQTVGLFVENIAWRSGNLPKIINDKIRPDQPEGWIVIMANMCAPVDVLADPANGNNTIVNEDFVPAVMSLGLEYGVIIIDNQMRYQDRYLIAHEMGHCRFLTHHETRGDGTSDTREDHNLDDHNCIMSYPEGGLTWNVGDPTEPRFCGKCNLKLRGWNIRAPGMPKGHVENKPSKPIFPT